MVEIDWTNADGEGEIVARALTLIALVKPTSLARKDTLSGTIVVPRAPLLALRDACEAAYPGSIGRVRAILAGTASAAALIAANQEEKP